MKKSIMVLSVLGLVSNFAVASNRRDIGELYLEDQTSETTWCQPYTQQQIDNQTLRKKQMKNMLLVHKELLAHNKKEENFSLKNEIKKASHDESERLKKFNDNFLSLKIVKAFEAKGFCPYPTTIQTHAKKTSED